jgi:hypothetical protein
MILAPVPWAKCIKALPVLTLLCPSERYDQKKGQKHKLLTDWARQGLLQLCRWLPGRDLIFVGDSGFAVHALAAALPDRATLITRLRLDASLFAPPDQRHEHTLGRPAQKGMPLPKDAIGAVRLVLWSDDLYRHCPSNPDMHKIPPSRLFRMAQALCFAA